MYSGQKKGGGKIDVRKDFADGSVELKFGAQVPHQLAHRDQP